MSAPAPSARLSTAIVLALLLTIQLAIGLPWLSSIPRVYNDEAWEASIGRSIADEGRLRHGIIEGWGGMHVRFVQNQLVQPFALAAVFRVCGCSIWTSRFTSLLASLAAVAALYLVARRLLSTTASDPADPQQSAVGGDDRTGAARADSVVAPAGTSRASLWRNPAFWAVLLAMVHPWFIEISRRARPEIFYIALAYAALAVALHRPNSWWIGGLAALAALSHPTGAVLAAALLGAALLLRAWPASGRDIARCAAAAAVPLSAYAIYVAWAVRDPQVSLWQQMTGHRPAGFGDAGFSGLLAGEARRWISFVQWPRGLGIAVVFLIAWIRAIKRGDRLVRSAAVAVVLFAAALPFTTVNTTSRYLVALVPLLAVLIVRWVGAPTDSIVRRGLRITALIVYVGTCAGGIQLLWSRLHDADANRVFDQVAAIIARDRGGDRAAARDARVFGRMLLWFGGDRYRYGPFPIDHHWVVQRDAVRLHGFDYAVRSAWDFNSSEGVRRPPASMPAFRNGDDIDPICRDFGRRIGEFHDEHFGPFEIYALDGLRP